MSEKSDEEVIDLKVLWRGSERSITALWQGNKRIVASLLLAIPYAAVLLAEFAAEAAGVDHTTFAMQAVHDILYGMPLIAARVFTLPLLAGLLAGALSRGYLFLPATYLASAITLYSISLLVSFIWRLGARVRAGAKVSL